MGHDGLIRELPEIVAWLAIVLIQVQLGRWLLGIDAVRRSVGSKLVWGAVAICCVFILLSAFLSVPQYSFLPPLWLLAWAKGTVLAWGLGSFGTFLVVLLWRRLPKFNPERRKLLRVAGAAAAVAPFAATAFGIFVQRLDFRLREVAVPVTGLHPDLAGLTILQISDIHLSPFLSERDLARVVDMANSTKPRLAVVTGDLISSRGDPLDACLRHLSRLRAEAGIFGCLGNHETYTHTESHATREGARLGIRFLRHQSQQFRFGGATLNLAGVDYQREGKPYLVGGGALMWPGAVNVLLSHSPNVFPVAAGQGYDLVLAGHTHGGQITVEIVDQSISMVRFYTPYIYGLFTDGPASMYVTRGIGTVGVPARLGAPPEVTLLRLCAI